jgi:hypothetical protein
MDVKEAGTKRKF